MAENSSSTNNEGRGITLENNMDFDEIEEKVNRMTEHFSTLKVNSTMISFPYTFLVSQIDNKRSAVFDSI